MNLKIIFLNKTKFALSNNLKSQIKKIFLTACHLLKIKNNLEINLILAGPTEIKNLNKEYRKKDYQTDVLSFKSNIPIRDSKVLGDIVICPQIAKTNASKFNHSQEKEILILAAHGFLHLTNLDHAKPILGKKWTEIFTKLKNVIE